MSLRIPISRFLAELREINYAFENSPWPHRAIFIRLMYLDNYIPGSDQKHVAVCAGTTTPYVMFFESHGPATTHQVDSIFI